MVLKQFNNENRALRLLGIGVSWGTLWLAFWLIVVIVIGVFDPDSIDRGEGPLVIASILGPMGLFSGIAFAAFLCANGRLGACDLPLIRAVLWGILGTAIVQLAYLDHGDMGLLANIEMGLVFSVFGGVVTMVWLLIARRWSHWRSSRSPELCVSRNSK